MANCVKCGGPVHGGGDRHAKGKCATPPKTKRRGKDKKKPPAEQIKRGEPVAGLPKHAKSRTKGGAG